MGFKRALVAGLLFLSFPGASGFAGNPSDFKNFFLPRAYWNTPSDQIPEPVLQDTRQLIERALGAVYENMMAPMLLGGDSEIRMRKYFPVILNSMREIAPNAHLSPSGGVVRSALSYLYRLAATRAMQHPGLEARDVLTDLIEHPREVSYLDIKGGGSDWDLLVSGVNPEQFAKVRTMILNATNGPIDMLVGKDRTPSSDLTLYMTLFLRGEVREFSLQSGQDVQGGSTLDYATYDLQDGKLKDPEHFPGTVRDLVRGSWHYVPPVAGATLRDPYDTAIRGTRPFLELPYLRLSDPAYLKQSLQSVIHQIDLPGGASISDRAVDQLSKGSRNSVFGGAFNRIRNASPGTTEEVIRNLAESIGKRFKKYPVPNYINIDNIEKRNGIADFPRSLPSSLLMKHEEFMRRTHGGVLYHGTSSLDRAIAIIRGGFASSTQGETRADYGNGAYMAVNRELADNYTEESQDGLIVKLKVRDDDRVRVVDLDSAHQDAVFRGVSAQAASEGRDLNEYLAAEYGIDVIFPQGRPDIAVIENGAVIEPFDDIPGLLSEALRRDIAVARSSEPLTYMEIEQYTTKRYLAPHDNQKQIALRIEKMLRSIRLIDASRHMGGIDPRLREEAAHEYLSLMHRFAKFTSVERGMWVAPFDHAKFLLYINAGFEAGIDSPELRALEAQILTNYNDNYNNSRLQKYGSGDWRKNIADLFSGRVASFENYRQALKTTAERYGEPIAGMLLGHGWIREASLKAALEKGCVLQNLRNTLP